MYSVAVPARQGRRDGRHGGDGDGGVRAGGEGVERRRQVHHDAPAEGARAARARHHHGGAAGGAAVQRHQLRECTRLGGWGLAGVGRPSVAGHRQCLLTLRLIVGAVVGIKYSCRSSVNCLVLCACSSHRLHVLCTRSCH